MRQSSYLMCTNVQTHAKLIIRKAILCMGQKNQTNR